MVGILALILMTFTSQGFASESKEIYLIRHAEKQTDDSKNPSLTKEGIKRAENIAKMLANKDISAIYSSNYNRTRETAAPLAKKLNLTITIYDPRKLKEFAQDIFKTHGNLLIVGHSNTTPNLAVLLGGESFGKIDESEYDRIYRLILDSQGVKSKLLYSSNN